MTSRRTFLQILGVAPAAVPLAAKSAADKAIGDLVGISAHSPGMPPMAMVSGTPQDVGVGTWKQKVLRFLAENTLPEWFEEEARQRNRVVSYLDPDIAAKRSWSMAVKIVTQRERNIERAKQDAMDAPRRGLRSREFEEKFGVWI